MGGSDENSDNENGELSSSKVASGTVYCGEFSSCVTSPINRALDGALPLYCQQSYPQEMQTRSAWTHFAKRRCLAELSLAVHGD